MAFRLKDLGVLAYAHGFTYWYYRTDDETPAVQATDYFAEAADMLRLGDRITGSTGDRRLVDLVVAQNDTRGLLTEAISLSAKQ